MKPVVRLASVVLAAVLVLSGCGGGDDGKDADTDPSSDGGTGATTGDESATDGGEPGDDSPGPGDELGLGDVAPLTWKPKADLDGQVNVSVERVDLTTMKAFSAFDLDRAKRRSTPYYVHVKVENTGATNLAGVELPIFLDNGSDVLFPSARITSSFKPCPFEPLPKKFTQGKSATLCLVFLAPAKTKLEAIAMRPTEQTEPITWTGKITKPAAVKKAKKKS